MVADIKNQFPGKILLFGEYTVLSGGTALTIPFFEKTGFLDFISSDRATEQIKSHNKLIDFYSYLSYHNVSYLNLLQFNKDIEKGLYFNSSIPENYGVGSSGALVAAVYDKYSFDNSKKNDLQQLKIELSEMESFFHGISSGLDPLSSFIKKPIIFKNQLAQPIELLADLPLFLLDTGIMRKTDNMVKKYLQKSSDPYHADIIEHEIKPSVEKAMSAFLSLDRSTLLIEFEKISVAQLRYFKEMIPQNIFDLWEKGISTKDYFLKLCGAGGGGYILGILNTGKIIHPDFSVIYL